MCKRPSETRWRPFCSRRCADVDLHRWLSEGYRIPVEPSSEDGAPAEAPDDDDAP
jgi:hypothetical protein